MLELLYALVSAIVLILVWLFTVTAGAFTGGATGGAAPALTPLQVQVGKDYKKLKTPSKHPTFDEFCYPKSYSVQSQQQFAAEYLAPGSNHREMLIYHSIGAGKTCLAIQVALKWIKKGRPLILMPASLIPGMRNEIRGMCGGPLSMDPEKLAKLRDMDPSSREYKDQIAESDAIIDSKLNIMSYNKFIKDPNIDSPILIVDEVQNINGAGTYFKTIHQWISDRPSACVCIMSGTPIFDSIKEVYGLAKLLRIDSSYISPENVSRLFAGKVSYFAGAPAFTFPTTYVKVRKCPMSRHQARWYKSEVEAELRARGDIRMTEITNDFYIKSRQKSNVVYPHGLNGQAGMNALTPAIIRDSLETYSCKYARLIKKLKRGGLAFVYNSFTGTGGIAFLTKCLEAFGWQNYATEGVGPKRYAVWSGEQTLGEKVAIRQIFNHPSNDHGGKIQVLIGSSSIKEGVSLTRVRQVHILETYWNHSRLEQIYGRAVRYCSHRSLPKADRDVTIYLYCAVADEDAKPDPLSSIDLYMLDLANQKRESTQEITDGLMYAAIDRVLFQTT
jgi:hypothetical protein